MPIRDWRKVNAGIFHDFHNSWIAELRTVLNTGILPEDYYALSEQVAGETGPDVLTLQTRHENGRPGKPPSIAVGDILPNDMPLFLDPDSYVPIPLEATYQQAYRGVPQRWREVLET